LSPLRAPNPVEEKYRRFTGRLCTPNTMQGLVTARETRERNNNGKQGQNSAKTMKNRAAMQP
jgi:hypothetical protein